MKISSIAANVKAAARLADTNKNGVLATSETHAALKAGRITVAQAKLLQRLSADVGNSADGLKLSNYFKQLANFLKAAQAADTNKDGVLSKKEAAAAPDTFEGGTRTVWSNRSMLKKMAAF